MKYPKPKDEQIGRHTDALTTGPELAPYWIECVTCGQRFDGNDRLHMAHHEEDVHEPIGPIALPIRWH